MTLGNVNPETGVGQHYAIDALREDSLPIGEDTALWVCNKRLSV
jgi:hypothetical protein